jgi:hypothetical protein
MKKAWNIFFVSLLWIFSCYQLWLACTTGTLRARSSYVSISDMSAPLFIVIFLFWGAMFFFPLFLAAKSFHKAVMANGGVYNKKIIKRVLLSRNENN